MFEAIVAIVIALVEAVVGLFVGLIELVAGLFAVGGQALGAGEVLLLLVMLLLELFCWLMLWLAELVMALLVWRKRRRVVKPVFWRPTKPDRPTQPDQG